MDYEQYFGDILGGLKAEGRYRTFADLERQAGDFPCALRYTGGADDPPTVRTHGRQKLTHE